MRMHVPLFYFQGVFFPCSLVSATITCKALCGKEKMPSAALKGPWCIFRLLDVSLKCTSLSHLSITCKCKAFSFEHEKTAGTLHMKLNRKCGIFSCHHLERSLQDQSKRDLYNLLKMSEDRVCWVEPFRKNLVLGWMFCWCRCVYIMTI